MKKFGLMVIAVCLIVFINEAWATPPACEESNVLWKERIVYDIASRRKNVELRQKLIDFRIQDNEAERKMADTEEQILAAASKDSEALWLKYVDFGNQRKNLQRQMEQASQIYEQTLEDRHAKKIDYKYRQRQKQYECLLNDSLNEKLASISKKISNKKYKEADVNAFNALVQQRMTLLNNLKVAFDRQMAGIDGKRKNLGVSNQQMMAYRQEEEKYAMASDQQLDAVHADLFDLDKDFEQYSQEIKKLSEQLFVYIDRF
ncbi:MAG: hypothetical protein Q7T03_02250 [Deltaproteobacteria bacterium]|nr:hypothetical protein [Deltaproteobacteria bacterium]